VVYGDVSAGLGSDEDFAVSYFHPDSYSNRFSVRISSCHVDSSKNFGRNKFSL